MNLKTEGVRKQWNKYKYAGLAVLAGAGVLLWAGGSSSRTEQESASEISSIPTRDLQTEMEEILAAMSGVGQVQVLLTLESDGERQLAQDTELAYSGDTAAPEDYTRRSEVVLAENGSDGGAVVTRMLYPTYRGALVVCQGGDQADVKLAVTEAVSALTGLSADRITVAKWQ